MQVQVNTDNNIPGRIELIERIEASVASTLSRFSDRLTRVEVHLTDENGKKNSGDDKRCLIEARPTGRQPVAVEHRAPTTAEALDGALGKLRRKLDSDFGRLDDRKP